MDASDAKRLKAFGAENAKLEKLPAESVLENEVTKEALRKGGDRTSSSHSLANSRFTWFTMTRFRRAMNMN